MRVLVTGNAGFMGSHLADYLVGQGHEVYGIDDLSGGSIFNVSEEIEYFVGNILDTKKMHYWFRTVKPEVVYHLAAYAAEGLSPFIRSYNYMNNVVGSANVINACINYGVRLLVFTSSMSVYGRGWAPFKEESYYLCPIDPYGVAKLAVERDLDIAREQHGLDYIIFRPHNVYGPRQNINDPYRNVIGIWMRQILDGKPLTIYGDGEQEREFTYIDDVTPYIGAVHTYDRGYRYNLGMGTLCTINHLAELVCEVTGAEPHFERLPPRHEVKYSYPDTSMFSRDFQPTAPTPLEEGLRRMWEWAKTSGQCGTKLPKVEVRKGLYPYWEKLL